MKSFITLLMAFILLSGEASAHPSLIMAFDEFDYAVSVEWDQEDQVFYHAQEELFATRLKNLKANGLTNEEIAQFVITKIKNESVAEEVRNFFDLIQEESLSSQEMAYFLQSMQKNLYLQGSSWNTSITGLATIATLVVIASAVMVTTPLFQLYKPESNSAQ